MNSWSLGKISKILIFSLFLITASFTIIELYGADHKVDQNRPDIYFISIEALPAEKISCLGYERNTTYNLCEFANNSSLYTRAYTPATYTPLTFASWQTGNYPFEEGV